MELLIIGTVIFVYISLMTQRIRESIKKINKYKQEMNYRSITND